jgi:hypothetical protein
VLPNAAGRRDVTVRGRLNAAGRLLEFGRAVPRARCGSILIAAIPEATGVAVLPIVVEATAPTGR